MDTGAIISLWCRSLETFKSIFVSRPANIKRYITGVGNKGKECDIYLFDFVRGGVMILNVPIAIYEGSDDSVDIILSRRVFKDFFIFDYNDTLEISKNCKSSVYTSVLEIVSENGRYIDVKAQLEKQY